VQRSEVEPPALRRIIAINFYINVLRAALECKVDITLGGLH
jgi:hypothetical protein